MIHLSLSYDYIIGSWNDSSVSKRIPRYGKLIDVIVNEPLAKTIYAKKRISWTPAQSANGILG